MSKDTIWQRSEGVPELTPGTVAVWRIPLVAEPDAIARSRALLTPDEIARAGRFRVVRPHDQFVLARAALRRLLGACLGVAPVALRFAYGPQGKPALAPPFDAGGVHFNLSHSGAWALAAFVRGCAVGVDIERFRPGREEDKLASRFFSPAEQAALVALPPAERAAAFHACWTCKEAYLKGRGDGLTFPLDAFDVALSPASPALLEVRGEPGEAAAWRLETLPVAAGYAAACAVRAANATFACYEVTQELSS